MMTQRHPLAVTPQVLAKFSSLISVRTDIDPPLSQHQWTTRKAAQRTGPKLTRASKGIQLGVYAAMAKLVEFDNVTLAKFCKCKLATAKSCIQSRLLSGELAVKQSYRPPDRRATYKWIGGAK